MTQFQKGTKVQRKDGSTFSNGNKVLTVKRVDLPAYGRPFTRVWFEETNTNINAERLELAPTNNFEEVIKSLEKELILYQDKVKEFANKVDKLEITLETLKSL